MSDRGCLIVEGHGEVEAALNLVIRLWEDLQLKPPLHWRRPIRGQKLSTKEGLHKACNIVRTQRDVAALLVFRDEDDDCPKNTGPLGASWLEELRLPFPCGLVLFRREYETLFLPCVHKMAGRSIDAAGRPGILAGTRFDGDPESVRGAKEWFTHHFPENRIYKPTLDQLPLTRMIDFDVLRRADNVPSFGSLERALCFLSRNLGRAGAVYPPPPSRDVNDSRRVTPS